ncbi:MAG TPA: hypothetical protein VGF67_25980 [Ktedonobacteraceae bacterium]|jgi:hypothetical protein
MPLPHLSCASEQLAVARDPEIYLEVIWQTYFADIPHANQVKIAYCQPWKRRLGLIRLSLDNETSFIGLNALLQLPQIPEYILITTIAHELVHYTHGFGSPLPRRHTHPHANNVVKREMERRGLGETMRLCDWWIDNQWFSFYDRERATGWIRLPEIHRLSRTQRRGPL